MLMKRFKALIIITVCVFFIVACVASSDRQQPCQAEDHSKKLRILIHKLDTVTFEPLYSELERDQYRLNYATQISEIVEKMVQRQQDEEKQGCGLSLSDQQLTIFNQLSSELQQQALHLVELIKMQRAELIKVQIHSINQICTACHQQLNIKLHDSEVEK